MHILEIQLLELIEEPVCQASRLDDPGKPALLLRALGLTAFVIGGRHWSHNASSPSRRPPAETKISSGRRSVNTEIGFGIGRAKDQVVVGANVHQVGVT